MKLLHYNGNKKNGLPCEGFLFGERPEIVLERRLQKLVQYTNSFIPDHEYWIRIDDHKSENLPLLEAASHFLDEYNKHDSEDAKLNYLKTSPLGFYLLSRQIFTDSSKDGFLKDIELDARGSPKFTDSMNHFSIALCEMKTGSEYEKSIRQSTNQVEKNTIKAGIIDFNSNCKLNFSIITY